MTICVSDDNFCRQISVLLHQAFKVNFAGGTRCCNAPVFKNLRIYFAEYANLFVSNHNCSLTSNNKAWIITFYNLVLVVKEVN